MDKAAALQDLEHAMAADDALPLRGANLVFGEGSPECTVMFIGEAPGARENELKRPFVGRAGQLLNRLLEQIGWRREDIYITNVVKRRPPENRDPVPDEIEAYRPYMSRQLEIIKPKVIAALGRFAMNYFLPEAKITRDQGKVFRAGGYFIVPLLHPAAALRSPGMLQQLEESFKKLPSIILACEKWEREPHAPQARADEPEKSKPPKQAGLF